MKTTGLATLGAVLAVGLAGAGQAQDNGDTRLYAEMWALAGVCNQLAGYDVQQDDLADFLNDRLGDAPPAQQHRIEQGRNERLSAIRAELERIQALPRGSRRQRSVDENTENLMARCMRLANNPTAGDFFRRAS